MPPVSPSAAPFSPVELPKQCQKPASVSGPQPSSGGTVLGALPGADRLRDAMLSAGLPAAVSAVSEDCAVAVLQAMPDPYAIDSANAPDTVSLSTVLADPTIGPVLVEKVIAGFESKTGTKVPPERLALLRKHPELLTRLLVVDASELVLAVDEVNRRYQAGKIPAPKMPEPQLPRQFKLDGFRGDALGFVPGVKRPGYSLTQLEGNLYKGSIPSALDDAQARRNVVVAEVLDRLAANNPNGWPDHKFEVTYRGKTLTRVEDFLAELQKSGHTVTVDFEHLVADFLGLVQKQPDGTFKDVAAPVMMKTGVVGAGGKEAVLPSSHGEAVIKISGPDVNGQVRWYQGVATGTRFNPAGIWKRQAWASSSVDLPNRPEPKLTGAQATEVVRLAGLYTQVVRHLAQEKKLYADGYAVSGVCNDSVAVALYAVTKRMGAPVNSFYPLMMRDAMVLEELDRRLAQANLSAADRDGYLQLKDAIQALPSDNGRRPDVTAGYRALASLSFAKGKEPFPIMREGREILESAKP